MLLETRVRQYLVERGCPRTWEHSRAVAQEARALALRFGVAEERAAAAGWLHDISAVIPDGERLARALEFGLQVLPEEEAFPLILHQKLSARLAHSEFGIRDVGILSAVGCHTTLKAGYTPLDLVLFAADKLAWDQPGEPPYLAGMRAGLEDGLECAALVYLEHLWKRRAELMCLHPWMLAARAALKCRAGFSPSD